MPKLTNSFIFKNDEIDILDNLYKRSKENKKFNNLIQYIFSDENINLAFYQLQENYMGYTPGIDNLTIQDIEKDGLASSIRDITINGVHGYRPKPTLASEIQKPGFSRRPLSVSCMYDKIIQQAIKQILEPICEAQFINNSYAFRPCYYVENAIARCYQYMQISKLSYVVQVDLGNFYTSVKHNYIIRQLWSLGIQDKTLIYILKQILNADIKSKSFSQDSNEGILCSGILFPLLTNIAFQKFDKWITSQWQENPVTNNYYSYTHKNGSKNVGTAYRAMRNTNLKEVYIVRYGSSIRLFCRNYQDAFRISKAVDKWFKKNMSFNNINSNIVNLRKRSMNFLGFSMKLIKKSNRWIVESHISITDYDIEKDKLIKQIKNIQHPRKGRTEYDEVVLYNSMVLKFQSYYKYATCINLDVNDLNWQISKILKNRLQKSRLSKKGRNLTKFEEVRFGKSKMLRYISGIDEPIYPVGYISHKNPMNKKAAINPYKSIGREAYIKENLNNDELLFTLMDNRSFGNSDMQRNKILLFEKQCGKCWISELPFSNVSDIHCHHIIAKKDNGTNDIENLVLISSKAHLLVHATSEKTIEKYIKELKLSSKSIIKINKLRESLNLEKIKI